MLKQFDNNVYVRYTDKDSWPLIIWSPAPNNNCQLALDSPEGLQKLYPEFSVRSRYFPDDVPLFKSRELGNYQLLQSFPGTKEASSLPAEISKLLGLNKKEVKYIGAYPPVP